MPVPVPVGFPLPAPVSTAFATELANASVTDPSAPELPTAGETVPSADGLLCDRIFKRAFSHHARGEHTVATALYEWLMELEPTAARAWHWYGVSRLEQGDAQAALNFISKAVTLDAADATIFLNLGNAMQSLGLHESAVQVYDAALALRPDYAQAALNCGNSLRSLRRFDAARRAYENAIQWRTGYGSAWFNLGNLLCDMGDVTAALSAYDTALTCSLSTADVWCNRGNLLKQAGRLAEALASYDTAIALKPDDATLWSNRGLTRHEMGEHAAAVADFEQALHLRPDYLNALCNKANSLRVLGEGDAAMAGYDAVLAQDPHHAQAHCNRGLLLRERKQLREAMAAFDASIRCNPELAQAYSNRALIHKTLGDYASALNDQTTALRLSPDFADAHTNLGALYHDLNRIEEAIVCHRQAIALSPQHPHANWNLSLDLILSGDMQEGWPLYEWRLHKAGPLQHTDYRGRPRWDPLQSLSGVRLLLVHEQGFGDTLQFCRYALMAEAAGAIVLLEAPEALRKILKTLSPSVAWVDPDSTFDAFDVWCPMLSLPLAFGTHLGQMPPSGPYLHADPCDVSVWEKRLTGAFGAAKDTAGRLRIGLCASGNPVHENTANRDVGLDNLLAVLPAEHQYVVLQKRISEAERQAMSASPLQITAFSDALTSFSDTAALCSRLDLVISVDTSVAHLAAAIGRPTWILLPWVPDWRWLMQREDTPWYATVRLFRQGALRAWDGPLQAVRAALDVKRDIG